LGLALARTGESGRAVTLLESLTRRRPNDGDCWQALGFAYMAGSRPRDAEIALRRAVVLPPPRADKHRDLGAVLAAREKEPEAREQYRKALALDPKSATTWVNLANLDRRSGRLEQALKNYREAERRDSTLALAFQGQIQTLLGLGRPAEVPAVYRRWLEVQPADHAARLEAVRFLDSVGRKDIALELARDGVRRNERSGDAHLMLGMALASSGATRAALAELRKAEALARGQAEKERARQLVAALRAAAPESLGTLFAADSVEHAGAVR
jgi:tetratricopeptide (TPR) repeat protein